MDARERAIAKATAARVAAAQLRKLTARVCPGCKRVVFRGLDEDFMALPVTVDREPLSRIGEAFARASGRQVYTLEGSKLYHREVWRIRKFPHDEFTVLAEHRCGPPPPPEFVQPPRPPKYRREIGDEPPF